MGSQTPPRLPIIDFTKPEIKPETSEWDSVKAQVRVALEEYGCFEASYNKIPLEVRQSLFSAMEELFDLPLETKLRNVSQKPNHGYVGQRPVVPLYEGMGIDGADILGNVENFTSTLWPQGNPSICKTIYSFALQLSELDQLIRRMLLESLDVEKYIEEHLGSTYYLFRVMKYKGPQSSETKVGINSHTDKNVVTILYQNQVEGLELQTKDGQWIKFKPSSPDSFIVMIGDSLYAWLNGRLHSPYHRVMMTGNEARYSTGLFSVPKEGYIVKAPKELIDEEHPLLFKPFDHVKFLEFYYTEAGQKSQSALKTYCGA